MIVCYLDDSDSEQSAVLTLAGYVQRLADWERFELFASATYEQFGVTTLHAKEFHGTKGEFEGWSYKKKAQFIDSLYWTFDRSLFGISYSVRKAQYRARQKELKSHQARSPYGTAFGHIVTFLGANENVGKILDEEGLSFIVESGHNNNEEIEQNFHKMKVAPFFKGRLRSLTFSGKTESKAIQLADLNAFYSRRSAARWDKYESPTEEQMRASEDKLYSLITSKCEHYAYTVRDPVAGVITAEEFERGVRPEPSPHLFLRSRRPEDPD